MQQTNKDFIDNMLRSALNVYHYGSYVYGTYIPGVSDIDFIVIVPNECKYEEQVEFDSCQYSIYTESEWQTMLDNNEVDAIETYFIPDEYKAKETKVFTTTIIKEKIRNNFSHVASNSFVKCKKKLVIENSFNPRVGKKSLWHSLRIIDFGIQILEHGKIVDYSSMNHLHDEIVNCTSDDWQHYKEKYQSVYNSLKSKFRACS